MKNLLSILSALAAVVVLGLFAIYGHPEGGAAMAMMVPMMPKVMGRRLLNRSPLGVDSGTFNGVGEDLGYPLYDRLHLLNSLGAANRTLFSTPVGTQRETRTLTYADTNVQAVGVPSSQKWEFTHLEIKWLSDAVVPDADAQSFLNYLRETSFRLQIVSKDAMFIVPMWMFFGPTQAVYQPAATINSHSPAGIFGGVWELPPDLPIVLQALTNWSIIVEPEAASAAALDGNFLGFVFKGRRLRVD